MKDVIARQQSETIRGEMQQAADQQQFDAARLRTGGGGSNDRALHTGTQAHTTVTMATGFLLGRSTAGAGAVEEITLGTNLSFTGTTLNAAGGGSTSFPAVMARVSLGF